MKRTHTCGELTLENLNQQVILQGWVKKIRKMGGMTFIDISDIFGLTQLVITNSNDSNLEIVKPEYVISVLGTVIERKSKNPNLKTGAIEVVVKEIEIINESKIPPFLVENGINASEETKMKYRYLDLRRPEMQEKLILRSRLNQIIRTTLENENFLEIETPYLGKSTPEGARDFLVPTRNVHKYYALPQSPQLYKQLLMLSGIDKYYQIVRCFRDEDLRIDRQPEFTQLDLEMSFADGNDVTDLCEKIIKNIFLKLKNYNITEPLMKLKYKDVIENYGTDKPDLRYDLKIKTLTEIFNNSQADFFLNLQQDVVRGICIDKLVNKNQLQELIEEAKQNKFSNLAFLKFDNGQWSGSLANKISEEEKLVLLKTFNIEKQATILLNKGKYNQLSKMLGAVRIKLANQYNLVNPNDYKIFWVVDFPLFEFSEEENRFVAAHHPFTLPKKESIVDFDSNKENALAFAYDLVINGFEVGGGSQRITDPEIQKRMFKAIDLSPEIIEQNFGWFVEAYQYGAPYHSGLALGLDRLAMILTNSESIRDVIAFPKTSSGQDLMNNSPDSVSESQLKELRIKNF